MQMFFSLIAVLLPIFVLAIWRAPLWAWAVAAALLAIAFQTSFLTGPLEFGLVPILMWLPALLLGALSVPALYQSVVIKPAFSAVKSILPPVSETERQALEAGTVGWDAELERADEQA